MYILFCVSIDTYIHGLVGWKSRWRGPNSLPPLGAIDTSLRQHAVLVVENFQRARVFGFGRRAFVAARDQHRQRLSGVTRTWWAKMPESIVPAA